MTDAEKKWIDEASYTKLLQRSRFALPGDPIFRGTSGKYYAEILKQRRSEVGGAEHIRVSKEIGWTRCR